MACESWRSLRSPRGRGESTERDHEGEGGRQGLRVLGGGERACVCVQKSSVQILDSVGLTDASVSVWLLDSSQLP